MLKRFQSLFIKDERLPNHRTNSSKVKLPHSCSTSYVKEPLLDKPNKIGIEPCVTTSTSSNISTSSRIKPADIDKHVQKGIEFHEIGELEKATHHFRQCAKEGSPIGMFLYGISLRHGWGCKANSALAFQYLQKAAEYAVSGLQKSCDGKKNDYDALFASKKGELVIAIYELGVSFQQGWGVSRSRETAFYYFKIAAQLGDADAQNEVGHCYYHGFGTKKDQYQAAKYYRMAAEQGRGLMGNSWIFKSKYDNVVAEE
ncbi:hcp-like partial [Lichtheimia corymbifera JMRC:FSU:9682]|uniref:Hcp-like partial n=1 Tax=Lichtheimia corymbifera JMRC:FSU:9682 TaxID=1263082 RepID=A0A068SH13_9FUNG|nr:hcp-like partial [Lichtheimia corymbifera JMRC:FSU:9682]